MSKVKLDDDDEAKTDADGNFDWKSWPHPEKAEEGKDGKDDDKNSSCSDAYIDEDTIIVRKYLPTILEDEKRKDLINSDKL